MTDFGIAKLQDADITQSGDAARDALLHVARAGDGRKLDGRSDIFSLGVVRLRDAVGRAALPGHQRHVDPVQARSHRPDRARGARAELGLVPQKWREVFRKVLSKKAENRYQTASSFVQDLEYCLGSWFTGLGDEDTVALARMAEGRLDDTLTLLAIDELKPGVAPDDIETVLIPRVPAPAPPPPVAPPPMPVAAAASAAPVLAREAQEETIVLAPGGVDPSCRPRPYAGDGAQSRSRGAVSAGHRGLLHGGHGDPPTGRRGADAAGPLRRAAPAGVAFRDARAATVRASRRTAALLGLGVVAALLALVAARCLDAAPASGQRRCHGSRNAASRHRAGETGRAARNLRRGHRLAARRERARRGARDDQRRGARAHTARARRARVRGATTSASSRPALERRRARSSFWRARPPPSCASRSSRAPCRPRARRRWSRLRRARS